MNLYFIKHKSTGYYIPEPTGYMRRGGSFSEPIEDKNYARIFKSERSAKSFLSQWIKGQFIGEREYEDGHTYSIGYTINPISTRKYEEMEIIKIELELP